MANQDMIVSRVCSRKFLGGLVFLVLALFVLPALAQQPSPNLIPKAKSKLKAQEAPKPKKGAKKTSSVPVRSARPGARQTMRRDPFRSLTKLAEEGGGLGQQLPPGKRGLVVSQLTVEGIVLGDAGRIAVVSMPGRDRAFFLRERDRLYDGVVKEILGDSVVFREKSKDMFGRKIERNITKELVKVPES